MFGSVSVHPLRFIRLYLLLLVFPLAVHAQPAALTITTEPNAIVWIDEVRRGTTDASGKLVLTKLTRAPHRSCSRSQYRV
jgi:hypothetical protein